MIDRKELEDIINAMNEKQRIKLASSFFLEKNGFVSSYYLKKEGNISTQLFSYMRSGVKGVSIATADKFIKLILDGVYDIIHQIKNADTRELSGEMKKMAHKEAFRHYVKHTTLLLVEGKEVYSKNLKTHPDAKVIKETESYVILEAKGKQFQISRREFRKRYNW